MAATPEADLARFRGEIDEINEAILDLLRRRTEVCRQVGDHKREHGIPMMQQDRLDALTAKVREFAADHGINATYLKGVFDLITAEACRVESEIIGDGDGGALGTRAQRIDHVAIAVRDIDDAISVFERHYGFTLVERRHVDGEFSGMKMATMRAGGVTFVLCEGDSPSSNVRQYIEHYGPGVQHIAIEVRDQPGMLTEFQERGADLLTGVISAPGLDQSFTKRNANTGIQLEFVTRTDNPGFSNVKELFTAMERENVF